MTVVQKKKKINNVDIPVVIFCGGLGTRLKEETEFIPKPLVRIGERPIVWHIMKIYHSQGFRKFILLLGYKGEKIKDYFLNYQFYASSLTIKSPFSLGEKVSFTHKPAEDWEISLIDTGLNTQTGGRLKRAMPYINTDTFLLTYGDGVGDVNIKKTLFEHEKEGHVLTMTAVAPPGRFGKVFMKNGHFLGFIEKPDHQDSYINGGFFVVNKRIFKYLSDEEDLNFEKDVLPLVSQKKEMGIFVHNGFWQCMDNLRDMDLLNSIWSKGDAPWKVWTD